MPINRHCILLLLTLLFITPPLLAAKKALVVGNAHYAVKPLRNPLNDSSDMATTLRQLGFQVTRRDDLTRKAMRQAIRDFVQSLNKGDNAFFYFSGHGVQVDNKNYLLPIANDIQREYEVSDGAVSLDFILKSLAHADSEINIVVLDACRNNPFPSRFKSSRRGLAKLDQQIANTLVAFAASPGGVSDDGDKNNGVYTQALLNHIATPNISLPEMFTRVRQEVYANTQNKQLPEEVNRLLTTVYLAGYKPYVPDQAAKIPPVSSIISYPRKIEAVDGRYRDHGDGTVTDSTTGLQWMRCSLGQRWQNNDCIGKKAEYRWQVALDKAETMAYAGHSDWRVPTIDELKSLVYCSSGQPKLWNDTGEFCEGDYQRPVILSRVFPNTASSHFWSASPVASNSNYAWYVNFGNGYSYYYGYKGHSGYVPLVRTGQ